MWFTWPVPPVPILTSTGVAEIVEVMVAMFGLVVLMTASAPLGTPADQLPAVFQSVLVLPFHVLWAWPAKAKLAKLKSKAVFLWKLSRAKRWAKP
jgi:hypothetical protein